MELGVYQWDILRCTKYNQYNLDLIKAINADCDAIEDQNDCDEPDTIDTTPTIAKTVPLILTTTLQVILCQINMFCHKITPKYDDCFLSAMSLPLALRRI